MAQFRYELRALNSDFTLKAAWGAGGNACNIHRYTDQLNRPGSAEFSLDLYDPKGPKVQKYTEVQIWRYTGNSAGSLVWWGVVVNIRAAGNRVVFNCQGLLWYLFRRFIGKADRTQKLLNPEFESDYSNWGVGGPLTNTISTTNFKTGTKSAKLVQTTLGADRYIGQDVSITAGTIGEWVTLAGWSYIESGGWVGPALQNRGLWLHYSPATNRGVDHDFAEIDSDTPRGAWLRYETGIWIPPSTTKTVSVRAYAPATSSGIYWDSLSLTLMESISYYLTDQATIFAAVVAHLQDPVYLKNNVNIATNMAATGVRFDWHSQFAEHRDFRSIVEEFTERANGFDIGFVYNAAGTTRTLTSYYPRKGSSLPLYNFTTRHLKNYTYEEDGERGISSMTILGEGDGPDREEGAYVDNTVFGGLILEEVEPAPQGADIARLDEIAFERQRVNKDPRTFYATFDLSQKDMSGIVVGDTIPNIKVDDGWTQLTGAWRVVEKTTAPHQDQLTLGLNPA